MQERIKALYTRLKEKNLDAIIVSSPPNISYLTKFDSRDSYFLISKQGNLYFTDSRYTQEAKEELKGIAKVKRINGSVFREIASSCYSLGFKYIAFEERHLAFAEYKKIKDGLSKNMKLVPTHSLIEEARLIKDVTELAKIRQAVSITSKALDFIKDFISPDKKEIEIAAELERFIRYSGAESSSFEIIVASGPNAAYPHHKTSKDRVKNNAPLMIDLGVTYQGYKSDLTRVFFVGKINKFMQEIYDIVLGAQAKAIDIIRPEVPVNKIDRQARQFIVSYGYAKNFGHALGHGVGLEVHEDPHLCAKEEMSLKEGMVFTVEPAIYLPGKFGIRIEDMVLVTKDGCEVLSHALHK